MPLRQTGLAAIDKRRLMRDLRGSLDAEKFVRETIGASNVSVQGDQVIHSCPLPFGLHRNGDTNPSAAFNRELLLFNCLVCGGGDILWYVRNVLDIDSTTALELVSGQVEQRLLTADEFLNRIRAIWNEEDEISFSMPVYSEQIIRPWLRYSTYFTDRDISELTQKRMRTGVDVRHRELYEKGSIKEWVEQPRVVMPLFFGGKLRGWQKRRISDEFKLGPKYRSSPGLPKDFTLYGWDNASGDENAYIVESPMTALKMTSQGFPNVLATLGASVTDDQIDLVRKFDSVHLMFDADPAGLAATEKVAFALRGSCKVWVCEMPEPDTDPGDYSREDLDDIIAARKPGMIWKRG